MRKIHKPNKETLWRQFETFVTNLSENVSSTFKTKIESSGHITRRRRVSETVRRELRERREKEERERERVETKQRIEDTTTNKKTIQQLKSKANRKQYHNNQENANELDHKYECKNRRGKGSGNMQVRFLFHFISFHLFSFHRISSNTFHFISSYLFSSHLTTEKD